MTKKISELLYDGEYGIMLRIREGEEILEDEKAQLCEFAKEVNEHLKAEAAGPKEIAICTDAIYTFMLHEEYKELGTIMYQNMTKGLLY